jgi:hypothetical protein
MQIENYNKKIEALKGDIAKSQKNIAILKKDSKVLESVKIKLCRVLQALTVRRIKFYSS